MKKIIMLCFLGSYQLAIAQLTLTVQGMGTSNDKGTLRCLIFNNANGFPKEVDAAIQHDNGTITGNTGTCTFENLSPGVYAVSLYHDKNNDEKLNKNLVGMPTEKYGFSNNAFEAFSPPSFQKAAFELKSNLLLKLNLK